MLQRIVSFGGHCSVGLKGTIPIGTYFFKHLKLANLERKIADSLDLQGCCTIFPPLSRSPWNWIQSCRARFKI